jgi:hypothetical protein
MEPVVAALDSLPRQLLKWSAQSRGARSYQFIVPSVPVTDHDALERLWPSVTIAQAGCCWASTWGEVTELGTKNSGGAAIPGRRGRDSYKMKLFLGEP